MLRFLIVAFLLFSTTWQGSQAFFASSSSATARRARRKRQLTTSRHQSSNAEHHTINGNIDCVEIRLTLPEIGSVTLLEATAEAQEVLVNQAIEDDLEHLPSGDPYGSVLWPASTTIASHLLQRNHLQNKRILELGTGTGLISLAATLGGAKSVLATDYESIPLKILEYAAQNLNGIDVGDVLNMKLFDLCDFSTPLPTDIVDVVVAADVMYEPATGKALAHRVLEALAGDCRVLIGDSPGRAGRPDFLAELKRLGLEDAHFVDFIGSTVTGDRHDLICGASSKTVSSVPEELVVAVMELDPADYKEAIRAREEKTAPDLKS